MTADDSTDASNAPSITPATLQDRIDAGESVRILDVRNRDEVEAWRIDGPSVTLTQKPHSRFLQAQVTDSIDEFAADVEGEGPITAVCARGEASGAVARTLAEAGYDAHNLAGGMEAWAGLLRTAELDCGAATLVQCRRPASGCLGYVVVADGEAAVIDPLRAFADRYAGIAERFDATLRWVLDSHVHADHLSGLRDVAGATGATPVMPARAVERGVAFDVETVADGDRLPVGPTALEAVAAPGHTTGMTAFAVGDALLTGDSLFVGSVARPDLEWAGESARELALDLHRTLTERFARFPDGTLVAPGHHEPDARPGADGAITARLGDLRELPVFDMSREAFVDYVTDDLPPRPANFEAIIAINLGRESAGEGAFELELGPNNCAAAPADD